MQYYINELNHPSIHTNNINHIISSNQKHTQHIPSIKQSSKSLFQSLYQPQQLLPLISLGQNFIKKLLTQSSSYFHRNINKHYKRTLIFLANYHKLLHIYSLKYQTPITNDMALHFILLLGYSRLNDNKLQQAKNIFKNVWQYTQSKSCDKVLLSMTLSNLSFLYLNNKQKLFKALECSLKSIQIMGEHLHILKTENLRNQLVQDSVILINSLILCKKTLKKIIMITNRTFYIDLYQYINQIGYKCSRKYLGMQSDFTKVFTNYQPNGRLPVFFQLKDQTVVQRTTLQVKILQQLQGIYEVLKTKRQPQLIYVPIKQTIQQPPPKVQQPQPIINQPIQSSQSSYPEIFIIQPIKQKTQNQQEMQASQSISSQINGWTVQTHILRPKSVSQKLKNEIFSQFVLGPLVIHYSKKRKQFKEVISPQRLDKILSVIDYEYKNLYDFSLKRITDEEFFTVFLFPSLNIDDDGHLQFIVKKNSIIKPYQQQFLLTKCLIFINHILGNNFRISICPIDSTLFLHVSIQLRPLTLARLFEMKQNFPQFIHQIYQNIKQAYYEKQIQITELKKFDTTQVTIRDQQLFKKLITIFLRDFQLFLLEIEQQDEGNLKFQEFLNNYQDQLSQHTLINFVEIKQFTKPLKNNNKGTQKIPQLTKIKGRFNLSKYLPNIQSIQLFSQNNFPSFSIESQQKAKGTIMIYGDKFEADFGIPLKSLQKQGLIKSILQIVVKRYELKSFFTPLRTHDEELYNQNAIYQLPLFCKSHKRTVIKDQNGYWIPVTISHLTVNNEIPLAFRIDAYFPCDGSAQQSIMVKLQPSIWQKPIQLPSPKIQYKVKQFSQGVQQQQKQNYHVSVSDYIFNKDYFLIQWCQMQGYDRMMKNLSIKDMKILFKGCGLRYYSLERLFKYMK